METDQDGHTLLEAAAEQTMGKGQWVSARHHGGEVRVVQHPPALPSTSPLNRGTWNTNKSGG